MPPLTPWVGGHHTQHIGGECPGTVIPGTGAEKGLLLRHSAPAQLLSWPVGQAPVSVAGVTEEEEAGERAFSPC